MEREQWISTSMDSLRKAHPDWHQAVWLKYFEGFGRRRIAKVLSISERAATELLKHGLAYLLEQLPESCKEDGFWV